MTDLEKALRELSSEALDGIVLRNLIDDSNPEAARIAKQILDERGYDPHTRCCGSGNPNAQ